MDEKYGQVTCVVARDESSPSQHFLVFIYVLNSPRSKLSTLGDDFTIFTLGGYT